MNSVAQEPTKLQRYEMARALGQTDGRQGHLCLPELYFVNRTQWIAYVRGYESIRGQTMLSRQAMQEAMR